MPFCVTKFLATLSAKRAVEVWKWIDSDPDAIYKMMKVLEANHWEALKP